jgi:hypothetical protein
MNRKTLFSRTQYIVSLLLLLALAFTAVNAQEATPEANTLVFEPEICAYTPDQPTSDACLNLITEHPKPELQTVDEDRSTLSLYNFWRVGPDAVNKYDAPGGNVIDTIPKGFNFVNAIDDSVEGWLKIEGGAWIDRSVAKFVQPSYFTGVLLPDDWTQPFAWVLDISGIYASLTPGGEGSADSGYLTRRYDMVSIFAEAKDAEGWTWYMIGPNQWLKQIYLSKVQPVKRPEGVSGRWVGVDLYEQTLVAYEDDKPVFATLISSGLEKWSTEEGIFPVWAKLPKDGMSGATGAPDSYALQSVPWVMYFNGSMSLHGTYWHDLFGYRRSHGCVNMSISDARWLFQWMGEAEPDADGNIVNDVYVYSSGTYGAPTATGI